MADDKKAAPEKKPEGKAGKKRGRLGLMLGIIIVLPVIFIFMLPTTILLVAGLIPAFVAMITDNDRQKSEAIAIGSLNCAGVTPFLIDLWARGQSWTTLVQILTNSSSWLIMYGTAALGWLIVFAMPPLLTAFTVAKYETRLKVLKSNLESLKTAWGADVATTKPLDKVGR
jgi:magnesium-transporting ATPase (P-type)